MGLLHSFLALVLSQSLLRFRVTEQSIGSSVVTSWFFFFPSLFFFFLGR